MKPIAELLDLTGKSAVVTGGATWGRPGSGQRDAQLYDRFTNCGRRRSASPLSTKDRTERPPLDLPGPPEDAS